MVPSSLPMRLVRTFRVLWERIADRVGFNMCCEVAGTVAFGTLFLMDDSLVSGHP